MTELRNAIAIWCKMENFGQTDNFYYEANIYADDGVTLIRKIEVEHDEFELISELGEGPFQFDCSMKAGKGEDYESEDEEDLIDF